MVGWGQQLGGVLGQGLLGGELEPRLSGGGRGAEVVGGGCVGVGGSVVSWGGVVGARDPPVGTAPPTFEQHPAKVEVPAHVTSTSV